VNTSVLKHILEVFELQYTHGIINCKPNTMGEFDILATTRGNSIVMMTVHYS